MSELLLREQPFRQLRFFAPRPHLMRLVGAGLLLLGSLGAQAQLAGPKAIPGAGSTGYATLAAAITDLNAQGVGAGGVTFNLAPGYTETAANLLITTTGTAANPIVFQKAAGTGANPTITAAGGTSATLDAIIGLQGADYVTFDGLTLLDPASNTTAATQMEWGFALLKTGTPAVDGSQNVLIRNCVITLQKGVGSVGIYANNHTPAATTQLVPTTAAGTNSNNTFYGNTISGVNNGIYVAGYAAASPYIYYDQNNEIGSVVTGTTPTGNAVTDYGTTATAYGIYAIYQGGAKVQGNAVNSTPATGATSPTGTLYGILVSTGGSADLLSNTVTVSTNSITSTSYGIQNGSGTNGPNGAAATVNIANNSLTMTSATLTTGTFYGVYNTASVANLNIFGNTLTGWSRTGATSGSNYMLYVSTGATTTQNVYNNTISNFTTTGASASVYGFYAFNNAAAAVQYYGNTLQNITSDGGTLYGLYLSGGATLDVYRNRVAALTANGTSAAIYGIYTTGTTTNVTNNVVGNFSTPNASNTAAQAGIYLAGGTTVNAQYNSVYLGGASTGTNFGTAGIYYTSTATTLVTLRNNVVVNTNTAAGTGTTAALRRSAGTAGTVPANLLSGTSNNLYYAGTPSATNLMYAESPATPVNAFQTLSDYKNFLAGRSEANSVTESPTFVSTSGTNANFLKVSATVPTQIESGGVAITGITTDYASAARSATAPDLGAYEGSYLLLDLTGPSISGAVLNNTSSTTSRTLVVTITDPSGVATGTGAPRLYYRKGTTGAFVFVNATSVSGSQYTFTLNYATVTGGSVAVGDVIQYYVTAQDLVATPNVSTSPGGGSGTTPPGTTAPATPGAYQIVGSLSGSYYVGTGTSPDPTRTFATLTAAANAYNINVLAGATTFFLLDATYSAAETFPITFNANPSASATNLLIIKPYTGVSPVITGSSAVASLILFNGADYVTLDGANTATGTTRNLTLTGTNAGAATVIWVGSLGANVGATNITLRNLNVGGGGTTSTNSFGIYASAAPGATPTPSASTYGDSNDNLIIQNNAVTTAYEAIFAKGSTVATSFAGLQIIDNRIGAALSGTGTAATGNVVFKGIDLQGVTAPLIARNFVLGMDAGTALSINIAAIELNANVTNAVISRNAITGLRQLSTGGWGAYGIHLASTTNITNAEISNNVISDILIAAYFNSTTYNAYGIRLAGGTGTKVYYNSVNLSGSIAPTTSYPSPSNLSAAFLVTSTLVTGLDVRDNIFTNSITTSAATSTVKSYAGYLPAASVLATSDYNDYFVSGPNGVLAYVAADVTTLPALKTATTKDVSSISVDPIFVSNTNLLPANGQVANGGTPLAVTVDYNGATRAATTPSIGAFQFTPQGVDVAPNALISPVSSATATCYGANTPVVVQIRNNGAQALNFAANPLTVSVVISGPASATQTLTQALSTGTLASAATQNITLTTLANFTPVGVYTFAITATVTGDLNTSNDLLTPAPTLNVAAPVVGTLTPAAFAICVSGPATLTLGGAANGSIQYQSSSSATGPFTNVGGATSAAYTTPTLTSTTYYRAQVSCGTNVVTSNVSAITVNNPVITAAPSPLSTCAGGTVTLSATTPTGVSVRYFTTATGGTAVGTGSPFVTPALTASTTYYAEAFAGGTENVGKLTPNQTDGGYSGASTGLVFTATGPTLLQSTTVFNATATAGSLTVELRDNASGALITTAGPFAIPAGSATALIPTVVPLNLSVPAAGTYRLVTVGTPPTLYRDFTGSVFPYTSPSGVVSITGGYISGTSTVYYFFYNMVVGSECIGASRSAIAVNVTPGLVASLPVAAANNCGRTPYQLAGTIAGSATGATYTSSGTGTFAPNATTLNATYTPSPADVTAGTVTLTLTPTGPTAPCTSTGRVVLTLATPPNAAFSYPAGTYCTGSAITVAPVLAPGAVAGTFSTTGFGLNINSVTGVISLANANSDGTYTILNTVATAGVCNGTSASTTFTVNFGVVTPTLTSTPQAGGVLLSTPTLASVTYQFFRNGVAVAAAGSSNTLLLLPGAQNGSYTVVVTSTAGCASAPSNAVAVTVTGTQTASLTGVSLLVYPNPTPNGRLTLELRGPRATASQLAVLNALGQVVHTGTIAAGTASLNLAHLAPGVYTFRVQTTEGVLTQRVVRE